MKLKCAAFLLLLFATASIAQPAPSVVLSWTLATATGTTYQVYRETSAGACTMASTGVGPGCLLLNSTPLSATTTSFTDTTAPQNVLIFYVVKGSASGFLPSFSNEVSITVPLPPSTTPSALTCTVNVAGGITTCK